QFSNISYCSKIEHPPTDPRMPKTPVSANADSMPALTRRALLAGTAATAASSAPVPAPALGGPPPALGGPDPAVSGLGRHLTEALATYAAAERRRNDCERRYLEDGPMPPVALTRAGPLGMGLREWEWWSVDELRRLLANRRRRRHWRLA